MREQLVRAWYLFTALNDTGGCPVNTNAPNEKRNNCIDLATTQTGHRSESILRYNLEFYFLKLDCDISALRLLSDTKEARRHLSKG